MNSGKKLDKKQKKEKSANVRSLDDVMESMLDLDQFNDVPVKQKHVSMDNPLDPIFDSEKNLETDKPEEIIKKMMSVIKKLNEELHEFKIHAEETYCTSTEFNRTSITTDARIDDLVQRLDMLEMENE